MPSSYRFELNESRQSFKARYLSSEPLSGGICIHGGLFSGYRLIDTLTDELGTHSWYDMRFANQSKEEQALAINSDKELWIAYTVCRHRFGEEYLLFFDNTSVNFFPKPTRGFVFPVKLIGIILTCRWFYWLEDQTIFIKDIKRSVSLAIQDKLPLVMAVDTYKVSTPPEAKDLEAFVVACDIPACPIEVFDFADKEVTIPIVSRFIEVFEKAPPDNLPMKIWSGG